MEQFLHLFMNEHPDNWDKLLPMGKFAYNSHMHSLMQQTLFMVDTGRHSCMGFNLKLQQPQSHVESVNKFKDHMACSVAKVQFRTGANQGPLENGKTGTEKLAIIPAIIPTGYCGWVIFWQTLKICSSWKSHTGCVSRGVCKAMALIDTLQQVWAHPVLKELSLNQIFAFLRLCSLLKNDIQLAQPLAVPITSAPDILPPSVSDFIAESIGIPNECMTNCWRMFKDDAWSMPDSVEMTEQDEQVFRSNGWKCGISNPLIQQILNGMLRVFIQHHWHSICPINTVAIQTVHTPNHLRKRKAVK